MGCLCSQPKRDSNTIDFQSNYENDEKRETIVSLRVKGASILKAYRDQIGDLETRENSKMSNRVQNFSLELFKEINLIRTKPEEFAKKIESYIEYISDNSDGINYIEKEGSTLERIPLSKGKYAFYDSIIFMQGLHHLPQLEYREDLEIPVHDNVNKWTKRDVLTDILEKKTAELNDKYTGYAFQFDLQVKDPELSAVLQLVDDSNFYSQRRNNILSHQFRFIGITHSDINNREKFCTYINLAY